MEGRLTEARLPLTSAPPPPPPRAKLKLLAQALPRSSPMKSVTVERWPLEWVWASWFRPAPPRPRTPPLLSQVARPANVLAAALASLPSPSQRKSVRVERRPTELARASPRPRRSPPPATEPSAADPQLPPPTPPSPPPPRKSVTVERRPATPQLQSTGGGGGAVSLTSLAASTPAGWHRLRLASCGPPLGGGAPDKSPPPLLLLLPLRLPLSAACCPPPLTLPLPQAATPFAAQYPTTFGGSGFGCAGGGGQRGNNCGDGGSAVASQASCANLSSSPARFISSKLLRALSLEPGEPLAAATEAATAAAGAATSERKLEGPCARCPCNSSGCVAALTIVAAATGGEGDRGLPGGLLQAAEAAAGSTADAAAATAAAAARGAVSDPECPSPPRAARPAAGATAASGAMRGAFSGIGCSATPKAGAARGATVLATAAAGDGSGGPACAPGEVGSAGLRCWDLHQRRLMPNPSGEAMEPKGETVPLLLAVSEGEASQRCPCPWPGLLGLMGASHVRLNRSCTPLSPSAISLKIAECSRRLCSNLFEYSCRIDHATGSRGAGRSVRGESTEQAAPPRGEGGSSPSVARVRPPAVPLLMGDSAPVRNGRWSGKRAERSTMPSASRNTLDGNCLGTDCPGHSKPTGGAAGNGVTARLPPAPLAFGEPRCDNSPAAVNVGGGGADGGASAAASSARPEPASTIRPASLCIGTGAGSDGVEGDIGLAGSSLPGVQGS
mmetsp:Transcript_122655/g.306308  ORF Transcript_122655/g.306308 Transcript_122655/m.306308 type:complete len:729 (-) Transcript_122655:333-2519(-)